MAYSYQLQQDPPHIHYLQVVRSFKTESMESSSFPSHPTVFPLGPSASLQTAKFALRSFPPYSAPQDLPIYGHNQLRWPNHLRLRLRPLNPNPQGRKRHSMYSFPLQSSRREVQRALDAYLDPTSKVLLGLEREIQSPGIIRARDKHPHKQARMYLGLMILLVRP